MVHGKKGFERIVWAFKNVLNSAVTWLFYDFDAKKDNSPNNTRKDCLCCPLSIGKELWRATAYLHLL